MAIPGRTDTARAANRSSPPNELVGGHVFAEHDRPIEFKFAITTVILLIYFSPNGAQTVDLCVASCHILFLTYVRTPKKIVSFVRKHVVQHASE